MSGLGAHAHGEFAQSTDRVALCPNCGSDDHRLNLIDEHPFRRAVSVAKDLQRLGRKRAAANLLARLAAVRIINILRHRYECNVCGALFDE